MMVSEEMRKRKISWEHIIAIADMKLDVETTPQS
jgi:hypothetical protein